MEQYVTSTKISHRIRAEICLEALGVELRPGAISLLEYAFRCVELEGKEVALDDVQKMFAKHSLDGVERNP